MKTEIEIYNMDSYTSFDEAKLLGALYTTVLDTQDDAVIKAVLNGMETAAQMLDGNAQYDYRIIKYSF